MKPVHMLTFAFALAVAACSTSDLGPHPDLSGKWKYNESLSENPRDAIRQQRGVYGRGGYGGGGGRGGWGGGMGPGGMGGRGVGGRGGWGGEGGREGRDGREGREDRRGMIEAPATLDIIAKGDEITIRDDRGAENTFQMNGRKNRVQLQDGNDATLKAQWKNAKLVTTTDINAGPLFRDEWELSSDGRQLIDTRSVEGGRFPFKVRRVYDRDSSPEQPVQNRSDG